MNQSGGGLPEILLEDIISAENLLTAWQEFIRGKRNKPDVQLFAFVLIDNIKQHDLANKTYKHGGYYRFQISDPKPRDISKASVRDRLLHHAIYRILYPFFDQTFIADSYSCRINKGTHKAISRLQSMFYQVSKNNTRTCWALKCDIKKFFASIDHNVLKQILSSYIPDKDILGLLGNIIHSFTSDNKFDDSQVYYQQGLPLGNLTSQLFVNIYMNKFDQFMLHKLKTKYYIRYADDFVILSQDRNELINQRDTIEKYLLTELRLVLHPNKIILKTFASGVDFLGWVNFPDHRVLRTASKRRMIRKLDQNQSFETLQSYLGLLKHGNIYGLRQKIMNDKIFRHHMQVVNGNQIAQQILEKLKLEINELKTKPHLAVVLVGDDKASQTYARKKEEAAKNIGIKFSLYKFEATIKESDLIAEIGKIQKQILSGIIVQLPLPKNLDKQQVLNALDPNIDVDFLTWESLGKLVIGENILTPPSPGAILEILNFYKVDLRGQHIVLVGQGDLIGKPLTNLLIHMPVTLTICNKDTKNLAELTRGADILITGVGKANLIRGDMVKKDAVVIDAGVSFEGAKMHGDVNFDEVIKVASIVTPTPGGVGPITVAKLLENTVKNSAHLRGAA